MNGSLFIPDQVGTRTFLSAAPPESREAINSFATLPSNSPSPIWPAEVTRQPENDLFPHTFDFHDVEVIVLEGIFLLKREFRALYDLAFWVECSFETALARALRRAP